MTIENGAEEAANDRISPMAAAPSARLNQTKE